ncbi:MAG: GtrA family protein [Spirochaetaceae bacterium]|nr:GtrA family protein [Spirochaetaceae bacterium]
MYEFLRYVLVGGSAFVIDIGVLYFTKTYIFQKLATSGILAATACGFIAGLIYNYTLSILFVFKNACETVAAHKTRSFIVFTIIGLIGLGLTELLMYTGIRLAGSPFYLVVKVVTAGVVLLWNYIARKLLVFKGAVIER